ncbi:MAG TPA: Uma2 family endonuclease [Tepidisphaeraceae bacterium]|nr:Uma2 family endonuclease [Tepidisphaeraceae bacterium]
MSTMPQVVPSPSDPIELHTGDRMTREEFHLLYEDSPKHLKAELIGGTVYVASPLGSLHGNNHLRLGVLFGIYEGNTPGVEAGDNTTILLGKDSEPQPDLYLRVLPERGGQSKTDRRQYIVGAPELVAEIAHSSRAIDLHAKKEDYARYGVREYLVASLADKRLYWFDFTTSRELSPDTDGVVRVHNFPGFWIHVEALFAHDFRRLMSALQQGMDSPEHGAFIDRLNPAAPR